MRISLNWIKDYVDIEQENPHLLADKITKSGINIEKVETNNLNNLVIGLILDVENHPDSDHLKICKVDIKSEILQIICGASNVDVDQKVIVALPNAILPGNFEIKESIIRGVKSSGMICALFELGLESKEENYDKGIHILDNDAKIGENPITYLGIDDTVYELDLNPNRNDCLSHLGFAYQVGAVLSKKVTLPETHYNEVDDSIKDHLTLNVDTNNCSMYLTKMVKDVVIKKSPDFIKQRLESAGMRSINNVVDISNYIMLEYGQPLHFFDADKLGNNITVRMAEKDEKVITLDSQERTLNEEDIVITNGNKITAIAGVMGAENTDVDLTTKNIVIESAIFEPLKTRYTSIKLGLRSEASLRFEKTLNYEYTKEALNRACYLLETYADGKVLKDELVHDAYPKEIKTAKVSIDKLNKLLGLKLSQNDIEKALNDLEFKYTFESGTYIVIIPNRRMDVAISEDIIEEVASLYGYENITAIAPVLEVKKGSYAPKIKFRKEVTNRLAAKGLNEVKTYTLINEKEAKLFNDEENIKLLFPMSNDKAVIRTSILPSLLKVFEYNQSRNVANINIFEIANVYHKENYSEELKLSILMNGSYLNNKWQNKDIEADFYLLKGIVEDLLTYLGYENRFNFEPKTKINELHPGISATITLDKEEIGFIGKINPNVNKLPIYVCEISFDKIYNKKSQKIKYPEISKYPEVTKDVAFILDNNILAKDVLNEIKKAGGTLLKDIKIFDLYKGSNIEENKKSLAFSLTFRDLEKTLSDEEADIIFKKIIFDITTKFNCQIRDK